MARSLAWIAVSLVALGCSSDPGEDVDESNDSLRRRRAPDAGTSTTPAPTPVPTTTSTTPPAPAPDAGTTTTGAKAGTIVPLYSYPTEAPWAAIVAAKAAHPTVPVIAIINPASGPGASEESAYATGITKLVAAGIQVVAYVYTSYGARAASAVNADVDAYVAWYPGVTGIFFDEMAGEAGREAYYTGLTSHAKGKGLAVTIGNPGTDPAASYVGTVDTMMTYESAGVPSVTSLGGWHDGYARSNFAIIPYAVSSIDPTYVASAVKHVGYIYATNDDLPNPWDTLPPYFASLLGALE